MCTGPRSLTAESLERWQKCQPGLNVLLRVGSLCCEYYGSEADSGRFQCALSAPSVCLPFLISLPGSYFPWDVCASTLCLNSAYLGVYPKRSAQTLTPHPLSHSHRSCPFLISGSKCFRFFGVFCCLTQSLSGHICKDEKVHVHKLSSLHCSYIRGVGRSVTTEPFPGVDGPQSWGLAVLLKSLCKAHFFFCTWDVTKDLELASGHLCC